MNNFAHLRQFINPNELPELYKVVSWGIRNETRFITQDYNGCIIGCWQMADAFFRWYAQRHDIAICQDGQTRSLKDIIKDVSKTAQWSEQLQNIWEQIHIKGSKAIHNIDINDEEIAGLTLEQTYEAIVYICTHQYALKGYQYRKFVHPDSQQYLGGNTPKPSTTPYKTARPKPQRRQTSKPMSYLVKPKSI